MTVPSQNPEAAGLEVVAWRRVDPNGKTSTTDRSNTLYVWKASRRNFDDLVTAASAQAAIDAEKARADRLAKALERIAGLRYVDPDSLNWKVLDLAKRIARTALQQETQP